MPAARWNIDITSPDKSGMVERFDSDVTLTPPDTVRNDTFPQEIRLLRPSVVAGASWEDAASSGGTLRVGIGRPDLTATGGTFALSYSGNSTGLTTLAYNISAATLSTALNANAAITAAGGVTVELIGTAGTGGCGYVISFVTVGAKSLLVSDGTSLTPTSSVAIDRVTTGSASVKEVQMIRLLRSPYAYSTSWALSSSGTGGGVTVTTSGSATAKAVFDVQLPTPASGGSFMIAVGQREKIAFVGAANTPTTQIFNITTVADDVGAGGDNDGLGGKYFDAKDSDGPVRFWINKGSGASSVPATPAGGRLVTLDLTPATSHTAAQVATLVSASIDADASFSAVVYSSTVVRVTQTDGGQGYAPTDTGSTGFTLTVVSAGSSGALVNKYLTLWDANGSVGLWFTDGSTTVPPSGAAALNRTLKVTLTVPMTQAAMVTATVAILVADSQFTGSSAQGVNTVVAYNTDNGPRTLATAGTSGLTIQRVVEGTGLSATLPWNVTDASFADALSDNFTVQRRASGKWTLTAAAVGTWSTPTLTTTNLTFPQIFSGSLSLNTIEMMRAFAADSSDPISATLEIEYTDPNGFVATVFRSTVRIYRDVIDANSIASGTSTLMGDPRYVFFLGDITSYTGGGATALDGRVTVGWPAPVNLTFIHATDGWRSYRYRAGTDAESSPDIIRPDDYSGAHQFVFESVA